MLREAMPGLLQAARGVRRPARMVAESPGKQATLRRGARFAPTDAPVVVFGAVSPVDVRVVCATHRDLSARVAAGQFRQDLFYRLKVLALTVPPLRKRPEDVLPLACEFLASERTSAKCFSASAQQLLLAHPWPGNVRELQNAVRHGAALATGSEVRDDDLPDELLARGDPALDEPISLEEAERRHILSVLDSCGGSQARAAVALGIGRNTLWRKLLRYGSCTDATAC